MLKLVAYLVLTLFVIGIEIRVGGEYELFLIKVPITLFVLNGHSRANLVSFHRRRLVDWDKNSPSILATTDSSHGDCFKKFKLPSGATNSQYGLA